MPRSKKDSHLNSDEQNNQHIKISCEDCNKYISDKTRHFQSAVHLQNRQQINFNQSTREAPSVSSSVQSGVEKILNEKT